GRDVDDGREARMRNGAVVALEEVLAGDLPIRIDLELRAEAELEGIDVEHLGDLRRHWTQRVRKRRRVHVPIHEHKRPPGVERELDERQLFLFEAELALRSRGRA